MNAAEIADGGIVARRNRRTGTVVVLVDTANGGSWLDDEAGRWVTVCCDHGGVCNHLTRAVAESFLSVPDEWCEECTLVAQQRERFTIGQTAGSVLCECPEALCTHPGGYRDVSEFVVVDALTGAQSELFDRLSDAERYRSKLAALAAAGEPAQV